MILIYRSMKSFSGLSYPYTIPSINTINYDRVKLSSFLIIRFRIWLSLTLFPLLLTTCSSNTYGLYLDSIKTYSIFFNTLQDIALKIWPKFNSRKRRRARIFKPLTSLMTVFTAWRRVIKLKRLPLLQSYTFLNKYFLMYENSLFNNYYPLSTPLKPLLTSTFTHQSLKTWGHHHTPLLNPLKLKLFNRTVFLNYIRTFQPRVKLFTTTSVPSVDLVTHKTLYQPSLIMLNAPCRVYTTPRAFAFTNSRGPNKLLMSSRVALHSTLLLGYTSTFTTPRTGSIIKKPTFITQRLTNFSREDFLRKLPFIFKNFLVQSPFRRDINTTYTSKHNLMAYTLNNSLTLSASFYNDRKNLRRLNRYRRFNYNVFTSLSNFFKLKAQKVGKIFQKFRGVRDLFLISNSWTLYNLYPRRRRRFWLRFPWQKIINRKVTKVGLLNSSSANFVFKELGKSFYIYFLNTCKRRIVLKPRFKKFLPHLKFRVRILLAKTYRVKKNMSYIWSVSSRTIKPFYIKSRILKPSRSLKRRYRSLTNRVLNRFLDNSKLLLSSWLGLMVTSYLVEPQLFCHKTYTPSTRLERNGAINLDWVKSKLIGGDVLRQSKQPLLLPKLLLGLKPFRNRAYQFRNKVRAVKNTNFSLQPQEGWLVRYQTLPYYPTCLNSDRWVGVENPSTYIKRRSPLHGCRKLRVLGKQVLLKPLSILGVYTLPFILSNVGFLYISSDNTRSNRKYLFNLTMIQARLNVYRLSFFYKADLKRIFLKKSGFLKLLTSFKTNNLLLTSNYRNFSDSNLNLASNTLSKGALTPRLITLFFNNSLQPFRVRQTLLNTPDWTSYVSKSEPNIRRVRFKPGYQRIWRRAREALNFTLGLNTRYQVGLTRQLIRMRRVRRLNSIRVEELKLSAVLLNMRLVFDYNSGKHLLNNELVYINGVVTSNGNLPLFLGDFIQLIITLRYYVTYRWLLNWNHYHNLKFAKLTNFKTNSSRRDLSKQVSRYLPNWIFNIGYRVVDIPKYLEVDYFTLSALVLYDPLTTQELNPLTYLNSRTEIYPMYNWKFIN